MKTAKKLSFCLLLTIAPLIYSCKHDESEFAMRDDQFIDSVYPEMRYQQQLNLELQKIPNRKDINSLGYKRATDSEAYFKELAANANIQEQPPLQQEHIQKLNLLRNQDSVRLADLKILLIDSDQKIIGYHVKATGSTGLENADLRVWAEKKLHYWTTDLNELQLLK